MPRAERNRRLFASAIAGSTSSRSTTSRPTTTHVAGTDPTAPIVLEEEERVTTATRTDTSN